MSLINHYQLSVLREEMENSRAEVWDLRKEIKLLLEETKNFSKGATILHEETKNLQKETRTLYEETRAYSCFILKALRGVGECRRLPSAQTHSNVILFNPSLAHCERLINCGVPVQNRSLKIGFGALEKQITVRISDKGKINKGNGYLKDFQLRPRKSYEEDCVPELLSSCNINITGQKQMLGRTPVPNGTRFSSEFSLVVEHKKMSFTMKTAWIFRWLMKIRSFKEISVFRWAF